MPANDTESLEYKILQLSSLHSYFPLVTRNVDNGETKDFGATDYVPTVRGSTLGGQAKTDFQESGYSFNADNEMIDMPVAFHTNLLTSGVITIGCWFYLDSLSASAKYLCYDPTSAGSTGLALNLRSTGNEIQAGARSQTGDSFQFVNEGTTLSATTWYFVAAVYDFAGDQIGISLNGGNFAYTAVTFGAATYNVGTDATIEFGVGAQPTGDTTSDSEINGSIMHFFTRTATTSNAEIADLYSATAGLDKYRKWTDYTASGSGTLSLTLRDTAGAAQASLTGLQWLYYHDTPANIVATPQLPNDYGSGATTDGSGVFSVSTITGPGVGAGDGYIVITDSDGNPATSQNAGAIAVTLT